MGEDRTGEPQANHERLTVAQAAAALGITEGAVRSRIKRGTLATATTYQATNYSLSRLYRTRYGTFGSS